jgi:methionyl aminopeptidase
MTIDTQYDVRALKRIGRIVADCLGTMQDSAEPGMTTLELDRIGADFLEKHSARSAPILAYNFPGTTCISVSPDTAHGVPDDTELREGDLLNIDVSAELDGYFADTGGSFTIGEPVEAHEKLCDATREALAAAMHEARAGARLNRIGRAIQTVARDRGYRVIHNLGSHGTGRKLHEYPDFIPGFYRRDDRRWLEAGMVITIEPFLTTGGTEAITMADGWTLRTSDGISAQFEHTMIITDGQPIVCTERSR